MYVAPKAEIMELVDVITTSGYVPGEDETTPDEL